MPELPEVETVVRGLKQSLIGQVIKNLSLSGKKFRYPYPSNFSEQIIGTKIINIKRRAKYILIELENLKTIIIHLGMSGKVLVGESLNNAKHDHADFEFQSGLKLKFNDARRFGLVTLVATEEVECHKLIVDQGLEPLEKTFDHDYLYENLQKRKQPIKLALMDNKIVVGVGNIYASELLFRSGIHPIVPSNALNLEQVKIIVNNIKVVLLEAIESGGSTLRDYVRSSGDMGYFQHKFKVYARANKPCISCETLIEKTVIGGRSAFFCSKCQK